ncbi:hypothetical protein [Streptomyces europaeiscabiei]|uniref:hypothetical protein n=1 Tax=Streptomyces europaeiscabiei TaxID=146819 RepID=UPI002E0D3D10|nr:hypothetical protein OHB30_46895 [Streptomyces europaeiscabiei]
MPDAVVTGAGPNGLVAADLLAGAGWSVEQRQTTVYVPRRLRLTRTTRAAIPPLVLRTTRRRLPRLETEHPLCTPRACSARAPTRTAPHPRAARQPGPCDSDDHAA